LSKQGSRSAFCDLPTIDGPVGKFMLRQMLSVAELEAGFIGERTRKALAAAKARGVKLGGNRGNLPAVGHKGRAISAGVRREKVKRRAQDLVPILADIARQAPRLSEGSPLPSTRGTSEPHAAHNGHPCK
jgi:DNA invertase Pin-like site-specific DNA recombinase